MGRQKMKIKRNTVVKVLPKGQIILPKKVRKELCIEEGDVLILKRRKDTIELKKAKTIKDFYGFLKGNKSVSRKIIDKVVEEVVKEREKGSG